MRDIERGAIRGDGLTAAAVVYQQLVVGSLPLFSSRIHCLPVGEDRSSRRFAFAPIDVAPVEGAR